jgi:hypothetical protein
MRNFRVNYIVMARSQYFLCVAEIPPAHGCVSP